MTVENNKDVQGAKRFTAKQIEDALRTIRELARWKTGLPENLIDWAVDLVQDDLVNVLNRHPVVMKDVAQMKTGSFF
jgi:hypothetical protein